MLTAKAPPRFFHSNHMLHPHAGERSEQTGPVLVVENDEGLQAVISDALEMAGYRAIPASDGSEALELLENSQPSLVLLDLFMPGMDGFEFLRRIREDVRFEAIPVIVVTGANPRQRLGLPNTPVLRKPLDLQELLFAVSRYLR